MKKFALIGLIAYMFISCNDSNIKENQNYIGFWTSAQGGITYTLDVKSNGSCNYKVSVRSGNKESYSGVEGKFLLQDSILKIGSQTLIINEAPTLSNGIWYLTLNKNEYTRK